MRKSVLLVLFSAGVTLGAMEVNPWDFMSGKARFGPVIRIDSTQSADVVAAGALVELTGPVKRNASLFGAHVRMLSDVEGNLTAAGAVVEITGEVKGRANISGATIYLKGTFNDSLEAAGAVVFLSGHVKGPVFVSAAEIYVEPGAVIEDTLRYSAGSLNKAEGAVLASGSKQIIPEPESKRHPPKPERPKHTFAGWLIKSLLGFFFLAGAGLFLSLVLPRHFKQVTGRGLVNPGFSSLVGTIAFFGSPLVVFLAILLFVTIVGIGAGLFVTGLYIIGVLFSGLYAGTTLGRFLLSRLNKGKEPHIILSMLLGTFIAALLCRIPYVGWIFGIASFIFGFGSLIITLWLEIKPGPQKVSG